VAGPADNFVMQANFTVGNFFEAGDTAQQRGLAAAGGAEQAGDAASRKLEIHAGNDSLPAIALIDAVQFKLSHSG